jgi:alcohol/geraniol dehydrogenase (NADP+)
MMIHAYAATAPQRTLEPFSYTAPPLLPYEVLIKISHCGLCHSDIHLIEDNWKKSVYPLVPGHEVVGTIVEKGALVDSLKIGERVGVSWIRSSCLNCPECVRGDTNICSKKTTTCNGNYGGFADHMTADSRFVFPIPDKLDSPHAAPLLCAGATVYAPLSREKKGADQKVAVIGIGGLGHLALQFAQAMGYDVTAISHSASKEKEAKLFGANHFLILSPLLPLSQFDLILSTVHEDLDWNQILLLLKPKGTLCFLGRSPSPAKIEIGNLISPEKKITGSTTANRSVMSEMLSFAARHKIKPQIEKYPLAKANEAIQKVKENKARYRIVLECE